VGHASMPYGSRRPYPDGASCFPSRHSRSKCCSRVSQRGCASVPTRMRSHLGATTCTVPVPARAPKLESLPQDKRLGRLRQHSTDGRWKSVPSSMRCMERACTTSGLRRPGGPLPEVERPNGKWRGSQTSTRSPAQSQCTMALVTPPPVR